MPFRVKALLSFERSHKKWSFYQLILYLYTIPWLKYICRAKATYNKANQRVICLYKHFQREKSLKKTLDQAIRPVKIGQLYPRCRLHRGAPTQKPYVFYKLASLNIIKMPTTTKYPNVKHANFEFFVQDLRHVEGKQPFLTP